MSDDYLDLGAGSAGQLQNHIQRQRGGRFRKSHLCSNPRPSLCSETPFLNKTNQMGWRVCLGIDINRNCMELMNWLVSGTTEESLLASLSVCS